VSTGNTIPSEKYLAKNTLKENRYRLQFRKPGSTYTHIESRCWLPRSRSRIYFS